MQKGLSRLQILIMAITAGVSVASLYYVQPILDEVSKSLHKSENEVGLLPALAQAGYGLGLFFITPYGDKMNRKKLILLMLFVLVLALFGMALIHNLYGIYLMSLIIGAMGAAAQVVMPMAATLAIENKAKKAGHGPKRSILFLHVTGEEKGLFGSSYYSDNPIFPLANTVANLNIDMIGRVDPLHKDNPNFVYVVGSEMLSSQLKEAVEKANKATHNLYLDYKYDDPKDPDRIYYRSDHYNFAKHNIPIAFFFDGIHEDYHKPTDTPDKIDYPLLMKRTQLVFAIAWDLANRPDRIVVDKK